MNNNFRFATNPQTVLSYRIAIIGEYRFETQCTSHHNSVSYSVLIFSRSLFMHIFPVPLKHGTKITNYNQAHYNYTEMLQPLK